MADVCEITWAQAIKPHRDRWAERGNTSGLKQAQREYAANRCRSLARTYEQRTRGCGERGTEVICGCGKRMLPWGCRQHLTCVRCRVARSKRLSTRIRKALQGALEAFGPRVHAVMMTVALRHHGDMHGERRELAAAWERFRKAVHKRFGAFPFVGTVEFTPGRDKLGHPHLHVVCIWPRTFAGSRNLGDFEVMRKLWVRAAGVERRPDGSIKLNADGKVIKRSENVRFSYSSNASKAAGYIAKYVAKGVTSIDFGPTLAAKICAATYNTRWCLTSKHFWHFAPKHERLCPTCGLSVCRVRFGWRARDAHHLRVGLRPERFDDWKPKPWGPFKRKFAWGWQYELPLRFAAKVTALH